MFAGASSLLGRRRFPYRPGIQVIERTPFR
jgi:hypothetical protein